MRRTYYDHEPAYRRIKDAGGRGWDDLHPGAAPGSYDALDAFLAERPRGPVRPLAIDLGCGGGQASLRIERAGYSVLGVDFSPTAIDLARANAAEEAAEAEFMIADCLSMPKVPSGAFDLAIDNHTLHCLVLPEDRRRFLAEARRVLHPGGVLFSETMSAEGEPDFEKLGVDPKTRIDEHRTRYWVLRDELRTELAEAGFEIRSISLRPQPERPNPGCTIVTVASRV
ncbi:MAG: class I SAM-dependent methyltransferase [Phycisphaerales bacterium]|nr:MAG: class I SAM-dependent methyltransferase [Phycisphaerales bacterium]